MFHGVTLNISEESNDVRNPAFFAAKTAGNRAGLCIREEEMLF
jgi:hypothetical protein